MIRLKNKKILFISPSFFDYEKEIKKELVELGAVVDFYDDRPSNDFFTKVFIRLNIKHFINNKIDSYYDNLFLVIENINYDFIFVITPETLDQYTVDLKIRIYIF